MMSKLSLLDKLKILGDVTSSSGLFVVAIIILIGISILLVTTTTRTKKLSKYLCIGMYSIIIILTLIFFRTELFKMFDYMMNNLFVAIYFPNLAIYFAAIIITNIIFWVSIFNRKISKWIRVINTSVFCMITYILILVMSVISKNKLDIFSQTSIYQNKNALGLIELSSTIFIIWILFLLIYKAIRIYQENQGVVPQEVKEKVIIKERPIFNKPIVKVKKEIVEKKKLPANFKNIEAPRYVFGNYAKKEEEPVLVETIKKDIVEEKPIINIPEEKEPVIVSSTPKKKTTPTENIPTHNPIPFVDEEVIVEHTIPEPILSESPQFLDIMLQDQGIMKPQQEKSKDEPQLVKISKETKPTEIKPKTITEQKSPQLVIKPVIEKPVEPKIVSSPKEKEEDILSGLKTVEDCKKFLAILKSYQRNEQFKAQLEQRQESRQISEKDLVDLVHRTR